MASSRITLELEPADCKEIDGVKHIDIKNGLEKLFWDLSKDHLQHVIDHLGKEKGPVMKDIKMTAQKVSEQREFMKRNQMLRDALLP